MTNNVPPVSAYLPARPADDAAIAANRPVDLDAQLAKLTPTERAAAEVLSQRSFGEMLADPAWRAGYGELLRLGSAERNVEVGQRILRDRDAERQQEIDSARRALAAEAERIPGRRSEVLAEMTAALAPDGPEAA